jgi:hypothetical protein
VLDNPNSLVTPISLRRASSKLASNVHPGWPTGGKEPF